MYNCLEKLKIKQVKELSFKRGKAGCNREVYNAIKYINSRVPDGHQTNNDLENHEVIYDYKIGEEKHQVSKISTKAAYLKLVKNQTVVQRYKTKWKEYLNLTDYNWEEVWNTIHHSLCHNEVKSDSFKQVHLKFFSPYIQGKTDFNAGPCNLCKKVQESQKHHVVEFKVEKEIFFRFGNLINALKAITMTKHEMIFGMIGRKTEIDVRNLITF